MNIEGTISLLNNDWNMKVEVTKGKNSVWIINVYNNSKLVKSHEYKTLRMALVAMCNIIGAD